MRVGFWDLVEARLPASAAPLDSGAVSGSGSGSGAVSGAVSGAAAKSTATAWGLLVGLPSESAVRASVAEELADVWGESEGFLRDASLAELLRHSIREKDEL